MWSWETYLSSPSHQNLLSRMSENARRISCSGRVCRFSIGMPSSPSSHSCMNWAETERLAYSQGESQLLHVRGGLGSYTVIHTASQLHAKWVRIWHKTVLISRDSRRPQQPPPPGQVSSWLSTTKQRGKWKVIEVLPASVKGKQECMLKAISFFTHHLIHWCFIEEQKTGAHLIVPTTLKAYFNVFFFLRKEKLTHFKCLLCMVLLKIT